MTIDTRDAIVAALGSGADRILIDKASLANAVAGQVFSLWTAGTVPAAGAGLFDGTRIASIVLTMRKRLAVTSFSPRSVAFSLMARRTTTNQSFAARTISFNLAPCRALFTLNT